MEFEVIEDDGARDYRACQWAPSRLVDAGDQGIAVVIKPPLVAE